MVKRMVPGALALAVTLTLVGCPGDKDPKPNPGELSLAAYCALVPDIADVQIACLRADPAVVGSLDRTCAAIEAEVTAGRLIYHGDRARACVDAWSAVTCDSFDVGFPQCEGPFAGAVANGGACMHDVECTNGHCVVEATCPGVCTAYVGVDGACAAAGARCAPDLSCGPDGRCVAPTGTPPAKQGEACVTGLGGCGPGLYCDPGTKTCAPKKKSGSCKGAYDACAFGYACTDDGSCVVYSGRGEHCGVDAECGLGWACTGGTCGAPPGIGSPCAVGNGGVTCASGAYCDVSTSPMVCRAKKPDGAACSKSWECESYSCTAGTCEPVPHTANCLQ